jgi:hypothetical protein
MKTIMKNTTKFLIFTTAALALAGCAPGPVTLGTTPVPVTDAQGHTKYVKYKVDKKRIVTVPVAATGSDLATDKIRAAFAEDSLLSQYDIDVSVQGGVAKLSGQVPNKAARSYAVQVARHTKGVLAADASQLVVTGSK